LAEKEPHILPQYHIDPYAKEVDFVFLNTCGFISSARDEAAHTLKKLLQKGKKVYLLGCAVQYYKNLNSNNHFQFIKNKECHSDLKNLESESNPNTQNIFTLSRNDFNTLTLKKLLE
jgi:tRNA A37 methylthiotransferase MiaB